MIKNLAILGSTGSIGLQALDVAKKHNINVVSITANKNIDLLEKQAVEFQPEFIAVADQILANELAYRLRGTNIIVGSGKQGLVDAVTIPSADMVLTSVVGIAGLIPTMNAIKAGKDIALANKETLVTAGKIVMQEAKRKNVKIIPVDSEHSAILQCLMGNNNKSIEKIILTASGGPFRCKTHEYLKNVTKAQALKHPNWSMGQKITIDSATLMNKGLEVIEAKWLFDVNLEDIEVVVHPQSVIHSMVEFKDSSVMAQLGCPDMRVPIQLAFSYPQRLDSNVKKINFFDVGKLTFERPDYNTFKCLKYAFDALEIGGTMPVVLNAANEIAVEAYLKDKISFISIERIINNTMEKFQPIMNYNLEDVLAIDREARIVATSILN